MSDGNEPECVIFMGRTPGLPGEGLVVEACDDQQGCLRWTPFGSIGDGRKRP